jgi:putative peptidoglycan lipid II flippase
MGRNAFLTVWSGSFGIVAGVALDVLVVALFGMGRQTDAYYIANTIPMAIITLLVLQATRVVQPILIRKRDTEGPESGWNYLNLIVTTGTGLVSALCLIGILSSSLLMRFQAGSAPEELAIATRLSVFFFFVLPLYFPIAVFRAALNSFDIYGLPGSMKFFENVFKIVSVLLFWRSIGIQSLAVGMLAGALWQLGIFYVVLKRRGFHFRPIFHVRHPDMVQAYSLVGFQLSGQAVGAGVDVLSNTLGSMLGAGFVTAFRLATRIMESFAGLLLGSVVLAAMPPITASVVRRDDETTKAHLRRGLYLLLLVGVPLSVWLGLVNRPLIALLYERGSVSPADVTLVSSLVLAMIPYVLLGRFRSLFEVPFFAEQNTWIPVMASLAEATVYVVGSILFVSRFSIFALPASRAVGGVIGSYVLAYLLKRKLGRLGFGTLGKRTAKLCVASGIMGVFVFVVSRLTAAIPLPHFLMQVAALGLPTMAGAVVIGVSLFLLDLLDQSLIADILSYIGKLTSKLTGKDFLAANAAKEERLP